MANDRGEKKAEVFFLFEKCDSTSIEEAVNEKTHVPS